MAVELQDFLIKEDLLTSFQFSKEGEAPSGYEQLEKHFSEGKPLQELFGFSNEVVSFFYEAACGLLEQKRYDDAANAFVFLTTLNPYLGEFWIGLGMAEQGRSKFDEALFAYSIAFHLEERAIFPYVLACQCCLEQGRPEKALEILDEAEAGLSQFPDDEVTRKFRIDLNDTREYVSEQKKRGGR